MRADRWIVEKRHPDGSLDFSDPQPETVFGMRVITGMTDDALAKIVWRYAPDATLDGASVGYWPRLIDPNFIARRKTW